MTHQMSRPDRNVTYRGHVLVVMPDLLSMRAFVDTGILRKLHDRCPSKIVGLSTVRDHDFSPWSDALAGIDFRFSKEAGNPDRRASLLARLGQTVDAWLDRRLGYYPLALRFSINNGFHAERMAPGHENWFLDPTRRGPLPNHPTVNRFMERWHYGRTRYVPHDVCEMLRGADALVTTNLQHSASVPYLVEASRRRVPIIGSVASWDHPFGKGIVYRHCTRYIVQNEIMKTALVDLHNVPAARIAVSGWPQTDVYAKPRPLEQFRRLMTCYQLDPSKPCVMIAGNTATNAPYELNFVRRFVAWWRDCGARRFSLILRPHPKNRDWAAALPRNGELPGCFLQSPSYTDIETLATLLRHVDAVVTNAGTILLDSIANDRPATCVLYDEGASQGVTFAVKNVSGHHYRELMSSGAFYKAEDFDGVVRSVERCLAEPKALHSHRRAASRILVGELDGHAGDRVVDAILQVRERRAK